MNYHIDFCETGQGTAAAARSNVTPKAVDASTSNKESRHDDTSHRPICGYASQRRCNAEQFGQRAFDLRLRRGCRRVRSETLFSRVPLIPAIRIGPLVKRARKPVSINTEPT